MEKKGIIENLLEMDEKELYIELGLGLSGSFGIETPKNKHALLNFAKTWYLENKNHIVKEICSSEILKQYLDVEDTSTTIEIIAAMADIISGKFAGVPPLVLGAMLFKEGLKKLCN